MRDGTSRSEHIELAEMSVLEGWLFSGQAPRLVRLAARFPKQNLRWHVQRLSTKAIPAV